MPSSWTDPDSAARADVPAQAGDGTTLFTGDRGELPNETRRVLVQLLLGPALDAQRQSKLWPVLLRDERILRGRLNELFLDLVIDHDHQVAFTRQIVAQDVDVPILLRKAPLTFIQSVLLLFLRKQLTEADARGERAVVSRDEMHGHLRVFERERNTDQAKFDRQAANAVEKANQLGLIRRLRGGEDRYEVSPTLKLLFPAEEIIALTETYARLAEKAGRGELDGDDDAQSRQDEDES